jgi:hypothetical protein
LKFGSFLVICRRLSAASSAEILALEYFQSARNSVFLEAFRRRIEEASLLV